MSKKLNIDIKKLMASDKARTIFIVTGLAAIVLIFLSSSFVSGEEVDNANHFDTNAYHQSLSEEIKSMVESIEGAGKAKVMLTLENSYEYVYLDDDKTLRQVNEPTIRGVVVACEGGNSPVVCAEITDLLRTILNVPSNKVCVSKLT